MRRRPSASKQKNEMVQYKYMNTITIDDFSKVEIRIGTVLQATKVPEADRLIQLILDFGELEILSQVQDDEKKDSSSLTQNDINRLPELVEKYPGRDVRQIMSAIAPFYPDPNELVGKQIAVSVNLEPRKFKGYESQGMIMATDTEDGLISLLIPEKKVKAGSKIH